ncbi:MAG: hypothetical protein HXY34_04995 [Candidatus Thorarchaeota archaeon]|nr:hypothetical protein [Candidatus Thorarchaeota archaeon]
MSVRPFPETRKPPSKRILLIPVVMILVGWVLVVIHPYLRTGFIGIVVALSGALSVFLVGMVYADLWASSRRTRDLIRAREARDLMSKSRPATDDDPFEEKLDSDD